MSNIKRISHTGEAEGTHIIAEFPYNPLSCQIDTLAFFDEQGDPTMPTQGRLQFDYQSGDDGRWRPFDVVPFAGVTCCLDQVPRVTASRVLRVRITFSGFVAGITFAATAMSQQTPAPYFDSRVVGGTQAVTTQSFTELNVKKGMQFEAAGRREGATIENLLIVTGSHPIILKALLIQIDGTGLQYQFYRDPNATAGIEIPNYNLNDDSTNVSESKVYEAGIAAEADRGTPVSAELPVVGGDAVGNSTAPTTAVTGLERVLRPNTTYLLYREITGGGNNQVSAFYGTWYEGPLSTAGQ